MIFTSVLNRKSQLFAHRALGSKKMKKDLKNAKDIEQ